MKDVSYAIIIYKLINPNKIQGELSRKKKYLVTRDYNLLYFTLVNSYVAGDAWKDYQCSRNTYFDKLKEIVQNISPFLIGLNPLLITRQLTDCRVSFQYIFVSTFVGFSLALFDNNVLYGE